MAGLKRKDVPVRSGNSAAVKKPKTAPRILLETEPDSDPIIESDTTEHSGDDDGVSWPSDEESHGGVKLPVQTQKKPSKGAPAPPKKPPIASAKKTSPILPEKQPAASKQTSKAPGAKPKATSDSKI